MSEALFRIISLGLFIVGFISGIASANKPFGVSPTAVEVASQAVTLPIGSLIEDIRNAEEANALNESRWTQDVHRNKEDGLGRAQKLLEREQSKDFLAVTHK